MLPYWRGSRRALTIAAAAVLCAASNALAQHTHVAQVQIVPSDVKITVGAQTPFVATAYDAAGNPLTEATFVWSSSNPDVASIEQSGIATGRSPGLAIIMVRTGTGSSARTAQAPIEVVAPEAVAPPPPPAPARVALTPTDADLAVGAQLRFVATARDSAGNPFPGAAFTWSSSNPAVARVDSTGAATGVGPGLAIIRVRTGTGTASRSAEAPVRVTPAPAPPPVTPPVTTSAPAPTAGAPAPAAVQPQRSVGGPVPPASVDSLSHACDGNDGRACLILGGAYASGRGVTQDYGRAATLYQRGCELGAPRSCAGLAMLYQRGLGVQADTARARSLYQRACAGGDRQACVILRRPK